VAEEISNPVAIFAAWRDFRITFFCDVAREFFFRKADPREKRPSHVGRRMFSDNAVLSQRGRVQPGHS
jgi:hypothetical protein